VQLSNNQQAFLALVRAGLWEEECRLSQFGYINCERILRLAEEQSVVGLVAAGIEHVFDVKIPQALTLQFVGQALQTEQRNTAMNYFIGAIVAQMKSANIKTLLVKGQGIAQCYERPHWRTSGDVDFLLNDNDYKKAKELLLPLSSGNKKEERYSKHLGMSIDPWYVEIHGSLRTGLSGKVDKVVDEVQKEVFYGGNVRSWNNNGTTVLLPSPDYDVFFIFTHFIKHFYKEGMNLRQVCDWCRLLWTYRSDVKSDVLEKRLRKAGLMEEWKAFAALAVDYLNMPKESMPLYDESSKWHKKASLLVEHILKGAFLSSISETCSIARIFPEKAMCYIPSIFLNVNGLKIKERLIGK